MGKREIAKHFKQTNNCPVCGSRVYETQYGATTEYSCSQLSRGTCTWVLDWATPGYRPARNPLS